MFAFLRKSGMHSISASLLRSLGPGGLPAGTNPAALGMVETQGSYAGHIVTYFRWRQTMHQCDSKIGGRCTQAAIWRQDVHAGDRTAGRLLYQSYWCDEHAERINQRRKREMLPPSTMLSLVASEASDGQPTPGAESPGTDKGAAVITRNGKV
jgi:hypothetical protein